MSGNVLLRQAQHGAVADDAFTLGLARMLVAGKLKNQRQVLLRGAREARQPDDEGRLSRAALDLAASLRALPEAGTLDVLRGFEGEAARTYFEALNLLVRPDLRTTFVMNGRSRRPPRDRMNALLSFFYSMWMNDCRSACEAAGLDAQIGFLHAVRPGRAALALDLMEEFRPFADRLALTLINRGQIGAGDFVEREGGAVLLEGDARKAIVRGLPGTQAGIAHPPLLAESVPLGMVPLVAGRACSHVTFAARPRPTYRSRCVSRQGRDGGTPAMLVIICYDVSTETRAGAAVCGAWPSSAKAAGNGCRSRSSNARSR